MGGNHEDRLLIHLLIRERGLLYHFYLIIVLQALFETS